MANEKSDIEVIEGFVYESLHRNNKQIKGDRADDLAEDLETSHKRMCEDLWREIRKLKRSLRNMYDFSPDNTFSLAKVENVNGDDVAEDDLKKSRQIRDKEINLELCVARHKELYGKTLSFD